MLKITETEIRKLQVGDKFGPFIATRREIHRVQANICNYRQRYPGAEFENKSKPYLRALPDGKFEKMKGFFEFYIMRTAYGVSADTGLPEVE